MQTRYVPGETAKQGRHKIKYTQYRAMLPVNENRKIRDWTFPVRQVYRRVAEGRGWGGLCSMRYLGKRYDF